MTVPPYISVTPLFPIRLSPDQQTRLDPGMVVRKVFRIRIRTFIQAHRIAPLSQRIRISHSHRIFCTFFAFSHFFDSCFTVSAPRTSDKCGKMRRKCEKCEKRRKSAKCKCDAKMESKFASHRTITAKKNRIFALFRFAFASHYHPWLDHQVLMKMQTHVKGYTLL